MLPLFTFLVLSIATNSCGAPGPHPCFPQLSGRGCGIASVLSQLCFVDEDVNSGKGFDLKRAAVFNQPGNEDELKFAKTCAKIFFLQNLADPAAGANAYFNAALAASYSRMFITNARGTNLAIYDTAKMQQEYNKDNHELTKYAPLTCFVGEHGANWFFCKLV